MIGGNVNLGDIQVNDGITTVSEHSREENVYEKQAHYAGKNGVVDERGELQPINVPLFADETDDQEWTLSNSGNLFR